MNGGVSLAVYIGGVAHELHELTRADGPYSRLVRHVGYTVDPVIDVLTGSSAGGINATALAVAQANAKPTDLGLLKPLWIEDGQIGLLLREPFQKSAPSLLKGDEYLYPHILGALRRLTETYERDTGLDISLTIPTTLLTPVSRRFNDELGTTTIQAEHAGLFRFEGKRSQTPLQDHDDCGHVCRDDFSDANIADTVRALALAARASAGFPVAFEPTFIPIKPSTEREEPDRRPNMRKYADWAADMPDTPAEDLSRFAVDGGVLANTPTRPALDAIREHRTNNRLVRRALILVYPHATPATTVDARPDASTDPPSLVAALSGVMRASSSIGSRTYVEEIQKYNKQAVRWRDGRIAALEQLPDSATLDAFLAKGAPPWKLFYTLRRQRAARVLAEQVQSTVAEPFLTLVQQARQAVESRTDLPFLPADPPSTENLPEGTWSWGIDLAIGVTQLSVDLLRDLLTTPSHELLRCLGTPEAVTAVQNEAKTAWLSATDSRISLDLIADCLGMAAAATFRADTESDFRARFDKVLDDYEIRMGEPKCGQTIYTQLTTRVCTPLLTVITTIASFSFTATGQPPAASGLLRPNPLSGSPNEPALLQRLLSLEIVAYLLTEETSETDSTPSAPVELYQLSAQVEQHFAPGFSPDDKLAGMSLNRFGAFLKRAWRANDWTWGRLDAAKITILILLSPNNIRSISAAGATNAQEIVRDLCANAFPSSSSAEQIDAWVAKDNDLNNLRDEAIKEVNRVLTSDDDKPLTRLAGLVAYGIQLSIAAVEVPSLVDAVFYDEEEGAAGTRSAALVSKYTRIPTTPLTEADSDITRNHELLKLFTASKIGQESVEDELPSDLMIRTAARTAATSATMLASDRSGLGLATPAVKVVRGLVAVPYWTLTGLSHRGPLARIAAATLLALGISLVALSLVATLPKSLTALVPTVGVGSILAVFTYAALRSRSIVHGAGLLGLFIPLIVFATNRMVASSSADGATKGDQTAIPLADTSIAIGSLLFLIIGTMMVANLNSPISTPFALLYLGREKIIRAWHRMRQWEFRWQTIIGVVFTIVAVLGTIAFASYGVWLISRQNNLWIWVLAPIVVVHAIVFGYHNSKRLRPMIQLDEQLERKDSADKNRLRRLRHASTLQPPREFLRDPVGISIAWSGVYGSLYIVIAILLDNPLDNATPDHLRVGAILCFLYGVCFSFVAIHVLSARRERRLIHRMSIALPRDFEPPLYADLMPRRNAQPVAAAIIERQVIVVRTFERIGETSKYLFEKYEMTAEVGKAVRLSARGWTVAIKAVKRRTPPALTDPQPTAPAAPGPSAAPGDGRS
ncbi:DUF3376 domain-containing protein [Gordonia sp. NPDC003424]